MTDPPVALPAAVDPPRRWLRWPARIAAVVAGLALGLGVAEAVFRHRDGGAFPHVNFYLPDPDLGVRLEPGATERIAFGGNPITSVRINAAGYRGADWPAPAPGELVVVGDSQVFGLGVEEDQTFAARLAARTHRPVINAGVPTYGPDEYRAVIGELLAQRHPATVVLALNMVNDLFEANHPNRTRHAVWDGWAVRRESAPAAVTAFPGRDFVFRRSHLFFALRSWWHAQEPTDERGFASEGSWRDLITTGTSLAGERAARVAEADHAAGERRALEQAVLTADQAIERVLPEASPAYYDQYALVSAARASAGDIVDSSAGEEARGIVVTAEMIRQGALVRARLRKELAAWVAHHRDPDARAAGAALGQRATALARLAELDTATHGAVLDPPLAGYVRDVARLCGDHGARLVVVVLPIDVQVSAREWAKYGKPVTDMAPTRVVIDELVAAVTAAGVTALDAIPALAAAEPGAFLDKDIHLTAVGHAAVAAALAQAIAAPPPVVGLPRTAVPVPAVWREVPEVIVAGSSAAGCETKRVHEWLRVLCGRRTRDQLPYDGREGERLVVDEPTAIAIERDDTGQAMALAVPHQTSLVAPLLAGRDVVVQFTWSDHTRRLRVTWPPGAADPVLAFAAPVPTAGKPAIIPAYRGFDDAQRYASPVERAICQCWSTVFHLPHYHPGGDRDKPEVFTCSGAYGTADPACASTYARDCARMLECIRRDEASPPR
jgi:hypothetical protein